ncbi:MAG: hypothetical protein CBC72_005130 [Gammaproteobacteria bacterium TMED112]|nr:MAG: hypothetical protein CBC72_005130 [Gammaproteobacteria bacterium TMED112]|tara:strand:- start:19489 stop:19674 length:186 start_codon:yes stop_codon:yes gene_type:complete
MKGFKFIAGAVCPSCGDIDSIVLKNDDSEIRCVSCKYLKMKGDEFDKKENNIIESIKIIND